MSNTSDLQDPDRGGPPQLRPKGLDDVLFFPFFFHLYPPLIGAPRGSHANGLPKLREELGKVVGPRACKTQGIDLASATSATSTLAL